jgi:hypothetical protein
MFKPIPVLSLESFSGSNSFILDEDSATLNRRVLVVIRSPNPIKVESIATINIIISVVYNIDIYYVCSSTIAILYAAHPPCEIIYININIE